MRKRFSWPPFDTDLLGAVCLVVVAVCLAVGQWLTLIFTLGVALICAISRRMKGQFEISSGSTKIKGYFDEDPESTAVKAEVIRHQNLPPEVCPQPSSREPDED